jgi:hypothetical protein
MPVSSASRSRDQPTSAPAALSYAGVNTWRRVRGRVVITNM